MTTDYPWSPFENVQLCGKVGLKIDEKAECTRKYMSILKKFLDRDWPKMGVSHYMLDEFQR